MAEDNVLTLPVLPLKNTVLFPYLLMPLAVGRASSISAVEAALATEEKEIVVFAQRDPSVENPTQEDLYPIGTKAIIRKMNRPNQGAVELLVLGMERVALIKLDSNEPYLRARVNPVPLPEDNSAEVEALHGALVELATSAIGLAQPGSSEEISRMLASNNENPLRLAFLLASMFSLDLAKEQALLEAATRADGLRLMHTYLTHEVQVLELRNKINTEARTEMTKEQREYLLRQQMRAIQQELGEKGGEQAEAELLRERLQKAELPEEVRKEAERELSRLEKLPAQAPDFHVIRTYLEYVLELPWYKQTDDNLDIANARTILDEDHFNLKDVKERILEQLGVLKLNPNAKAPILCLVGPPGTGKTSLGQSIARALNRKFERMSLGGLHDEAELRGHRRTYIGAMPGRLIQAIRRADAKNPVLMLDEIDKLGRDFRGDPASALLEVLDPEQNRSFRDNYLDLPFDLTKVLFITTANALDTIPRPLLDRMEVLRLSGYSEEEKVQIAHRYLIPRQLKEAGLTAEQCLLNDEGLRKIISGYTREAGLRLLERAIGRVVRKIALRYAEGKTEPVCIGANEVSDMLGPEYFTQEQLRRDLPPGVATGLAWTETGGDVLYVEGTLLPDGKGMTLTGQLGDVMQESARAAQSYLWAHAEELGIDPKTFKRAGVHIHVPAGAIPKDGPSAGVTMATALASLYTHLPARYDTAMTGEVTLTGLVLPIGGVKEKVLAARRAGIKRVILPRINQKDLRELPEEVRNEMEFVFADRVEDVLFAVIPQLKERVSVLQERPNAA
ncbi:MAG TPA: endopeptidase La [Bryobacteraceae bacterium]|nr:endopeptidase La [Bryobacteraceae bacterium]